MIMDLSCKVTANLDFERARLAAQLQHAKSPDLAGSTTRIFDKAYKFKKSRKIDFLFR